MEAFKFFAVSLVLIISKVRSKPHVTYYQNSIWDHPQQLLPIYSHRSAPPIPITKDVVQSGSYVSPQIRPNQILSMGHYHTAAPLALLRAPQAQGTYLIQTSYKPSTLSYIPAPHIAFPKAQPPTKVIDSKTNLPHGPHGQVLRTNDGTADTTNTKDSNKNPTNELKIRVSNFPSTLYEPIPMQRFNNVEEDYFKVPAGIAQSTQPIFSWITFTNPKLPESVVRNDIPDDSNVIIA